MRYTIDDIQQMPEGQTFERKSFQVEPKTLANTIVAMANADGGTIAIGIVLQEKLPRKTTQKNYPEKVIINSVQKNILDYIKQNPKANRIEISAKLGNISEGGVKYNLKVLQEKGFLKRVGPDKGGHWEVI